LQVAAGGILEWVPQECIYFPGAKVRMCTRVELEPGARFLGWEIHSLGRPAIGERFASGHADLSFRLDRGGTPLILDRLRLECGVGLDGPSGLRGIPVTGTLLACGATPADLAAIRADAGGAGGAACLWGATLVGDLLVARCLAPGTEPARRLFAALWGILRPRLLGLPACPPRIWGT
jgi:urease accessory protein